MNHQIKYICNKNPEHVFDTPFNDGRCPHGDGGVLVPFAPFDEEPYHPPELLPPPPQRRRSRPSPPREPEQPEVPPYPAPSPPSRRPSPTPPFPQRSGLPLWQAFVWMIHQILRVLQGMFQGLQGPAGAPSSGTRRKRRNRRSWDLQGFPILSWLYLRLQALSSWKPCSDPGAWYNWPHRVATREGWWEFTRLWIISEVVVMFFFKNQSFSDNFHHDVVQFFILVVRVMLFLAWIYVSGARLNYACLPGILALAPIFAILIGLSFPHLGAVLLVTSMVALFILCGITR